MPLDQIVAENGDFRKLVIGCRASGTALPYPDAWFSCYVSNLVLQLIASPESQIREAYRVLKPGSVAAFTVWGRKPNSWLFTVRDEAERRLRERGVQFEAGPANGALSNFEFGANIDQFVGVFREAGFAQVKHWFQMQNFRIRNGDEYLAFFPNLRNLDEQLRNEIKAVYDELSGAGTTDLKVFEAMIILAYKD